MKTREGGFTIIEILVSIIVLTVGVLALLGSQALVTRMIAQGDRDTQATQVAVSRMERLRQFSRAGATRCSSAQLAAGSNGPTYYPSGATASNATVTETWTVGPAGVAGTAKRLVTVTVVYRTGTGTRTSTFTTTIGCL